MPARFDLSALSRRRSAKFALALLTAVVVITLVTFTVRAWRNKTGSIAKQDIAVSQPAAAPTPEIQRHVQRVRLGLRLREAFKVLGDRLERPGKERLTMVGTLTRQSGSPAVPFRLIMESPGLMRLEEQVGAQLRIIGFDGIGGWKLGDLFKDADQEIIETLTFDSADRFFFGQVQGLPTRYLGPRFRLGGGPAATIPALIMTFTRSLTASMLAPRFVSSPSFSISTPTLCCWSGCSTRSNAAARP